MNIRVLRRKIKSRVETVSDIPSRKIPFFALSLSSLIVVMLMFCIIQLVIVSVLSPYGETLVTLNAEKDLLVEENRILEQKIAQRVSLSVIASRASNDLEMDRAREVLYLKIPSVSAEVPAGL